MIANEYRANVATQIRMLTPTMIFKVGRTAFGPPARIRTGADVRTITTLRSADFRTMLCRFGAGD